MPLKENLCRDLVKCLQQKEPVAISPGAAISQAIALMQRSGAGCLLVEEGEQLRGILTERDILKRVLGPRLDPGTPVREAMTPNPTTIIAEETIGSALRKMLDGGYRHLPVVDGRGRPTGRVSVREIVHYMVEHFPKAVYNLPPCPDRVPAVPEGA